MSSMAVTATTAAFLLGNTFLLPSIFTQLLDPDPDPKLALPPTYSASASLPSLSESLNRACSLDFFRFIAWDGEDEMIAAVTLVVLVDDNEVVEPVVHVGSPDEYIATADPGQEGGSGKSSGLMWSPFIPQSTKGAPEDGTSPDSEGSGTGGTSSDKRASVSTSTSFPISMTSGDSYMVADSTATAEDLFFGLSGLLESDGSGFHIFLNILRLWKNDEVIKH
jgi:hypothetical protein